MIYLLDTNTCITFLRQRNSSVAAKLSSHPPNEVFLCSVVNAELYYGAYQSAMPEKSMETVGGFVNGFESFAFDNKSAEVYGKIRSILSRTGSLIGPNDLLIASIALAHDAVLVTHNIKEFSRVPGLRIEDWEV